MELIYAAAAAASETFVAAQDKPFGRTATLVAVMQNNAEVLRFKGMTRSQVEIVLAQNERAFMAMESTVRDPAQVI